MDNRPTHNLKAYNHVTKDTAMLGVGWYNPADGSFSIRINPLIDFARIQSDSAWTIKLWPERFSPQQRDKVRGTRKTRKVDTYDDPNLAI